MMLACPNRCSVDRFELWNASIFVDSRGRYLEHHPEEMPLYRCSQCGTPAVDLAKVPGAIAAEREADLPEEKDYVCPACETRFAAPRAQNPVVCLACGQTFPVLPER